MDAQVPGAPSPEQVAAFYHKHRTGLLTLVFTDLARGRWHPAMHLVARVALLMTCAAYIGVAEAAREIALREARGRRAQPLA